MATNKEYKMLIAFYDLIARKKFSKRVTKLFTWERTLQSFLEHEKTSH